MSTGEAKEATVAGPGVDRVWDRTMIGLCAVVLATALVLDVGPGGRGVRVGSFPLPLQQCVSKRLAGWDCPGCGLTRSFVALAHGRWGESLGFHPVGWVFFLALAFQLPHRAIRLWRGRPHPGWVTRALRAGGYLLIGVLLAGWGMRLLTGAPPLP